MLGKLAELAKSARWSSSSATGICILRLLAADNSEAMTMSVILLPTKRPRGAACGDRVGGNAKLLGRSHTSSSLRHLADRLWIRRFLVRPQEGQLQAPLSLIWWRRLCFLCRRAGFVVPACKKLPRYVPLAGAAVTLDNSGKSAGRRIEL